MTRLDPDMPGDRKSTSELAGETTYSSSVYAVNTRTPEIISPPRFVATILFNLVNKEVSLMATIDEMIQGLVDEGTRIPRNEKGVFIASPEFMSNTFMITQKIILQRLPQLNEWSREKTGVDAICHIGTNIGFDVDITDYVKVGLKYKGDDKGDDRLKEESVEMIKAYVVSHFYALFTKIVKAHQCRKFESYICIMGVSALKHDIISKFCDECKKYFTSILNEKREELRNAVNFIEPITKAFEAAMSISCSPRYGFYSFGNGYIGVLHYVDYSWFHEAGVVKNIDGKLVKFPKKGAKEAVESKKKEARATMLFDDSKAYTKFIQRMANEFRNEFIHASQNGKFLNLQFPEMLEKLVDECVDFALESLKQRTGVEPQFISTIHCKEVFKHIIERSLTGYYAWINDAFCQFAAVTTNNLTIIDTDVVPLGREQIYRLMIPQIRSAIYSYSGLYPILIPEHLYDEFELILSLPPSKSMGTDPNDSSTHLWSLDFSRRIRVSDLVLADGTLMKNAARGGVCVWVYAAEEDARREYSEKKGDVTIDGVRFKLLVYNPNADYERTRYSFVRGCWFMLSCNDGKWEFSVLTRSLFMRIWKQQYVNTDVTVKVPGDNGSHTIVTILHQSVPLPMTQRYGDENNQLSNEYAEMKAFLNTNPKFDSSVKAETLIRNLDRKPTSEEDSYATNTLSALFDLNEALKEVCGDGKHIPIYREEAYVRIPKKNGICGRFRRLSTKPAGQSNDGLTGK